MVKRRREIKGIINRYKKELEKLGIQTKKIVLFGSYATNKSHADSDIDLIVISKDFKHLNLRERLEMLGLAAGRVFEPIEALGITPVEARKQSKETFVGEILNNKERGQIYL